MSLDCAPEPCGSCPYRTDCPSGIWAAEEYAKLTEYTPGASTPGAVPALGVFLCHQTNAHGRQTVCRGWLTVESDSVAVRLALLRGSITREQVRAPVRTPLYASGALASAGGLRDLLRPGPKARRLMARLIQKGAGR